MAKEKQITTFLECKKTFFGKVKYFFKFGGKKGTSSKIVKAKSKKEEDKILRFIEKLEFDLCELPRPDVVVFLYMPFEAAKELRKGRAAGDGNENSEEHLRKAEQTYLDISTRYGWTHIDCLKTEKFEKLEDIKSIDEISEEIIATLNSKLDEEPGKIKRMTRF